MADGVQVVRITAERQRADEWALTLSAVGIDVRIDWHPQHGYLVMVDGGSAAQARTTLAAFDRENQPPAPAPQPSAYESTNAALVAALLLCGLFTLTGPRSMGHRAFAVGAADAAAIWSGEWWRAVTALTLHADFPHVLSNAITLAVFGTALCALIGPGLGLSLLVLAGAGGNLFTSALHGTAYSAVGASTAIFGGLGALGALRVAQRRRAVTHSRWRAWTPLAAAIALLGMLGSAPHTDVVAHLSGFALGVALGAGVARRWPTPPATAVQAVLLAALVAAGAACWLAALHD